MILYQRAVKLGKVEGRVHGAYCRKHPSLGFSTSETGDLEPIHNEQVVKRFFHVLGHVNQTELRLLDPGGGRPLSRFASTEDEFQRICSRHDGRYNIYAGFNERAHNCTAARDVLTLNNVVFDLDVKTPKGCGSTGEELQAAIAAATEGCRWIKERGIHRYPVRICSGNGAYIWLCIPPIVLGNDHRRRLIRAKLRRFSGLVAEVIDRDGLEVDQKVTQDLARIIRVPGTRNLKGIGSDDPARNLARYAFEIDPLVRVEDAGFTSLFAGLEVDMPKPGRAPSSAAVRMLHKCRDRVQQIAGPGDVHA